MHSPFWKAWHGFAWIMSHFAPFKHFPFAKKGHFTFFLSLCPLEGDVERSDPLPPPLGFRPFPVGVLLRGFPVPRLLGSCENAHSSPREHEPFCAHDLHTPLPGFGPGPPAARTFPPLPAALARPMASRVSFRRFISMCLRTADIKNL